MRLLLNRPIRIWQWITVSMIAVPAVAIYQLPLNSTEASAVQGPCRNQTFEHVSFTVCRAVRDSQQLQIIERGPDGLPLRSFSRLSRYFRSPAVSFATNGGMYDSSGHAIGLLVEKGTQSQQLNTRIGTGNFYMMPNGVFYDDGGAWRIATTKSFAASEHQGVHFATQSGPVLVAGNQINPTFAPDGPSKYIRNGVGLDSSGVAWFAISNEPVSFGRFARLFQTALGCHDALYLDGFVSSLWDPASGRQDSRSALGPMIVATNVKHH